MNLKMKCQYGNLIRNYIQKLALHLETLKDLVLV